MTMAGGKKSLTERLLVAEGLWWITRPPTVATGLIAVPGWLAAAPSPAYGRLAAMVGAVMMGRAIANVVNDVLDEKKDRLTAPELPLPSGLVGRLQAILLGGVLVLCQLALVFVAAGGSWRHFVFGIAGCTAIGVLVALYSLVKPYPALAVPVTGLAYLSCPVTAWLVAGGGWSTEVWMVFAYALCRGTAANVFSTYRDIDRDAAVGNYSVAVRLGHRRAFGLGISLEGLGALFVLGIAVARQEVVFGAAVFIASAALLVWASLITMRSPGATDADDRSLLIFPLRVARNHVAIVLVQSLSVGLAAAAITGVAWAMEPLYTRRIIEGRLREAVDARGKQEPRQLAGSVGY
jgi:4-hydroxybenzoate polyprenyltransferase